MNDLSNLHNLAGLFGVFLSLFAYGRVQWQRDFAKTPAYSAINFVSSLLLLFSLSQDWNLPAVVSNSLWAALSLYGLYRCAKYKRKEAPSYAPPLSPEQAA